MSREGWQLKPGAELIRERMSEASKRRWTPGERLRVSEVAKNRWPSRLRKYGITEEQYRSSVASGNKWCCGHKAFHPLSEFTTGNKHPGPCRAYTTEKSNERYRSLSAEERSAISKKYYHKTRITQKQRYLWFTYKLTQPKYEEMANAQHGLCAICHRPPATGKRLVVDHDHNCCKGKRSCGKCVRGLICWACNRRMPLIDYVPWRNSALRYLRDYKAKGLDTTESGEVVIVNGHTGTLFPIPN